MAQGTQLLGDYRNPSYTWWYGICFWELPFFFFFFFFFLQDVCCAVYRCGDGCETAELSKVLAMCLFFSLSLRLCVLGVWIGQVGACPATGLHWGPAPSWGLQRVLLQNVQQKDALQRCKMGFRSNFVACVKKGFTEGNNDYCNFCMDACWPASWMVLRGPTSACVIL